MQPFGRTEIERCQTEVLNPGRFANAVVRLCRIDGADWVVKDFMPRLWLIRNTYGRHLLRRELMALDRLKGVRGVPQDAFRPDAFALAYRYMSGTTLISSRPGWPPPEYYPALEKLAMEMHARGIVHLDLRYRRNVLILEDGTPGVIDFQACMRIDRMPRFLQRRMAQIDLSGVYKHWFLRSPETLDEARLARYRSQERWRRLWFVRGYLVRPKRIRERQPAQERLRE
jgi:predicted Ser/Thr protein kinase